MTIKVKYHSENTDFFRKYYKDKKNQLFCTQPASGLTLPQYKKTGEIDWYICSKDGEPSHKVKKICIEVLP